MGKTDVLAVETLDIAHHFGLGVIFFEYIGTQIIHFADTAFVDRPQPLESPLVFLISWHIAACLGKEFDEVVHIIKGNGLVQRDAHPACGVVIEVNAQRLGFLFEARLPVGSLTSGNLQCIKKFRILLLIAVRLNHLVEIGSLGMDALGNLTDALGTMIDAIETCHHCAKCFGSTDIRCGFFALDMLLACLESQTISRMPVGIFAKSDNTSGQVAFVLVACSHIACRRSAKSHRQTEPLRCTAYDVGIKRTQQCHSHQVCYDSHFQPSGVAVFNPIRIILYGSVGIRQLGYSTEKVGSRLEIGVATNDQFNPLSGSACLHNTQGVLENFFIHKHFANSVLYLLARTQVAHHRNRLGSRSGFIQERTVRQRQPRKVGNHGLEIEQRLQTPLAHLRLIGCVGSVPNRVLQHIASDNRWGDGSVPTAADVTAVQYISLR